MNKKWKTFKIVAIVAAICIVIACAYFLGARSNKNTETTTAVTTHPMTEATTQLTTEVSIQSTTQTTTQQTTQSNPFEGIKLYLYYKANGEFKMQDITDYLAADINSAKILTPTEVERKGEGEGSYIEPEIRIYGVGKDASISAIFESEATKARRYNFKYNDGVSQFWYWNPKLYNEGREGCYSFKATITEPDKTEKAVYFKVSVS